MRSVEEFERTEHKHDRRNDNAFMAGCIGMALMSALVVAVVIYLLVRWLV